MCLAASYPDPKSANHEALPPGLGQYAVSVFLHNIQYIIFTEGPFKSEVMLSVGSSNALMF